MLPLLYHAARASPKIRSWMLASVLVVFESEATTPRSSMPDKDRYLLSRAIAMRSFLGMRRALDSKTERPKEMDSSTQHRPEK